jgi:hypothetical protein
LQEKAKILGGKAWEVDRFGKTRGSRPIRSDPIDKHDCIAAAQVF